MSPRTKWAPHEGCRRVAGKGTLGIYQGPVLWSPEAAQKARTRLAAYVPETWVEAYRDGAWVRE
jgi:hypothetical protein